MADVLHLHTMYIGIDNFKSSHFIDAKFSLVCFVCFFEAYKLPCSYIICICMYLHDTIMTFASICNMRNRNISETGPHPEKVG